MNDLQKIAAEYARESAGCAWFAQIRFKPIWLQIEFPAPSRCGNPALWSTNIGDVKTEMFRVKDRQSREVGWDLARRFPNAYRRTKAIESLPLDT